MSDHVHLTPRVIQIKFLLIVVSILTASVSVGQFKDVTVTKTWPSSKGWPMVGDTLALQWSKPTGRFHSNGTFLTMMMSFDHQDLHSQRAMDLEVTVEVEAKINNDLGNYSKGNDRDSVFVLKYLIGRRSSGVANANRVAPDSLLDRKLDQKDRQLFSCLHAHTLTFKLLYVRVDSGSGWQDVDRLPRGTRFDAELKMGGAREFNPSEIPDITSGPVPINCSGNGNSPDELLVEWTSVSGAVEYHLEWFWVDNYDNPAPQFDFRFNATRISTKEIYYRIPLLFDRGWIFYRVRAMGADLSGLPLYGVWSPNLTGPGPLSNWPGYARYLVQSPHRATTNWQVTNTYAEEGKRKEVMTYADGTLRSRQAVTRNNSLLVPIIGETFYDIVGRPAVESMPVPLVTGRECPAVYGDEGWAPIDLYPRFNNADISGNAEDYTYEDMLPEGDVCGAAARPFHKIDGAELYYHPSHISVTDPLTGAPPFLPQAEGYPFTQTEFTRDNTGRIRSKSGVGDEFKIGSGHETKFYYGKPEQIKLDRLFGSEAGYATHYQKNVVIDANGQASVSYVDRAGRTVATALAGGSNYLIPLNSLVEPEGSELVTDLFNGQPSLECEANELQPGIPALVFTDQFVVPANGLHYAFVYGFQPLWVTDPCLAEGICLECVYELSFTLVDQCGELLIDQYDVIGSFEPGNNGTLVFNCTARDPYGIVDLHPVGSPPPPPVLELAAGEYVITKTLRVHAGARDAYVQHVLNNGDPMLSNDCYTPFQAILETNLAAIDYSGCDIDCDDCAAALGELDDFLLAGGSQEAWQALYDECMDPCSLDSWCEVAYQAMLVDMTLGGQYADFIEENDGPVATDPTSVFYHNGSSDVSALLIRGRQWDNTVPAYGYSATAQAEFQNVSLAVPLWRQPRLFQDNGYEYAYRTESGERYTIPVEFISGAWVPAVASGVTPQDEGNGPFIYPEQLSSLDDFIVNWQPGFERSLLFYHPEYCYWLDCREYSSQENDEPMSSDEFDERLRLSTVAQAVGYGWLDLGAPTGQKVLFTADPSNGGCAQFDPFAVQAANGDYGQFGTIFLNEITQYHAYPNQSELSMEAFAAIMGVCPPAATMPAGQECDDFLDVTMWSAPDQQSNETYTHPRIVAQWEAYKGFYLSEKYRAQKRWSDYRAAFCGNCSGVNLCIGEGENTSWQQRMQTPVTVLLPEQILPSWPPSGWSGIGSLAAVIEQQLMNVWSNQFGRPIVQGCQPCNQQTANLFVNKEPRFPDPEQFPGMDTDPDQVAFDNYIATGDCPVAAGWRYLINEVATTGDLAAASLDISNNSGWAGLMIAQNGQGQPTPSATWAATANGAELSVDVNGCTMVLAAPASAMTTQPALWDNIFAAPSITATSPVTFQLQVHFQANGTMHTTDLSGELLCTDYDLINCNFSQVGTGNQLAQDLSAVLSLMASSDPQMLGSTSWVDLSQTPYQQYLSTYGMVQPVPTIQSLLPAQFQAAPWTGPIFWMYDQASSTFILANGQANGYPQYQIYLPGIQNLGSNVFEFSNMVSAGGSLFTVDVLGAPDWVAGQPPALLGNYQGSVTYHPNGQTSSGSSVGDYGYPDSELTCFDDEIYTNTMLFYQSMAWTLSLGPNLNASNPLANLYLSPYLNADILEMAFIDASFGAPWFHTPDYFTTMIPVYNATGFAGTFNLSPYNLEDYDQFVWANGRCFHILIPEQFIPAMSSGVGPQLFQFGFSSPEMFGAQNSNGNYPAMTFYALDENGEHAHDIPFIAYSSHCMEFNLCEDCPLDGPFIPEGTVEWENPCEEVIDQVITRIGEYNASDLSDLLDHDLDPGSEAIDLANAVGLCSCVEGYSTYLEFFIAYDIQNGAIPPPITLEEWNAVPSNCQPEIGCEESYQDYVSITQQFQTWLNGLQTPPTNPGLHLADPALFTNEFLCPCVDGYIARLQEVMLDDELDQTEAQDIWVWWIAYVAPNGNLQLYCQPSTPCDPQWPPIPDYPEDPSPDPCVVMLQGNAYVNAQWEYEQQMNNLALDLTNAYNQQCLNVSEEFRMRFQDPEHHYTLYYYDQAGNLVRTIPPEGIEQLPMGEVNGDMGQDIIDAIAADRQNGTHSVFTEHRMPSDHLYNSLNNPTRLAMPDHDRMRVWELGLPNGLPHDLRITGSQFFGNKGYLSGWRLAPNGTTTRGYVYNSADGGLTWSRNHNLVAADLHGVAFFGTGSLGYAVGNNGSILRTLDNGGSWDLMTNLTNWDLEIRDVSINNSGNALLVGHRTNTNVGEVFTLTSGGAFARPAQQTAIGRMTGVRGWVNSGTWWWYCSMHTPDGLNGRIVYSTNGIFNAQTGAVSMGSRAHLYAGHAFSTTDAYLAGESGALIATTDAGVTWNYRSTSTKDTFRKLHFVSATNGLAIMDSISNGNTFRVLRYTINAGQTWSQVSSLVGFNDIHYAGDNTYWAVGTNGLLTRVLISNTVAVAHVPISGPTGNLRSIHTEEVGSQILFLIGKDGGLLSYGLYEEGQSVQWSDLTVHASTATLIDLAVRSVQTDLRNILLLADNGRLAIAQLDLSTVQWTTPLQFPFTTTTPYTAIALRNNGMAVAFRQGTGFNNLQLIDLDQLSTGFLAQGTPTGIAANHGSTINELLLLGTNGSVIISAGRSNPTNNTIGGHAAIYRFSIAGTSAPYSQSFTDGRLSIRSSLPLNAIAKTTGGAVGNEGTLVAPVPGASAINWYVASTPILNRLNSVAAIGTNNELIAVGDAGMAFTMTPATATTFSQLTIPTTADLLDVVVNGTEVTITAAGGRVYYSSNYQTQPFVEISVGGGNVNGAVLLGGEVFAVGDGGRIHRLLGALHAPINEVFTPRLNDLHFSDPNNGYVVGNNMVARRTQNGGQTWNVVAQPYIITFSTSTYPNRHYNAVFNRSSGNAYAVGTGNLNAEFTGTTYASMGWPGTTPLEFEDVIATGSGAIIAVGRQTSSPTTGRIIRRPANSTTFTLGLSYANSPFNTVWAWPAYFGNEDILVGGNGCATVFGRYSTSTNNFTFNAPAYLFSPPDPNFHINDFYFHDRIAGYAAGTNGKLFRTDLSTNVSHSVIGWDNVSLNTIAPTYLGQTTQSNVTINTLSFADRHRGFLGGTYSLDPNRGYARTVRDELDLYSQRFWYDQLGRLILSQNSRQYSPDVSLYPHRYSYTLYDQLGRVREAGELTDIDGTLPGIFGMDVSGEFKPDVIDYSTFESWVLPNPARMEVTRTQYDVPFYSTNVIDPIADQFSNDEQENLRLRVAQVTYAWQIPTTGSPSVADNDPTIYDHASHYSYDIHGNVKELVQEHPLLAADQGGNYEDGAFKHLKYTYDLISGNVHEVNYQDGKPDQFHHRYSYDADNRIEYVETSRNNITWREDGRYFYYPHGPLQRVEIGDLKVQGLDYAYTLQGWLKAINSDLLLPQTDIGGDAAPGTFNALTGRDVYGLSLGYYGEEDYKPIDVARWSQTQLRPVGELGGQMAGSLGTLYNGNIAHTVNSLAPFGGYLGTPGEIGQPLAMVYQYDQLNRLLQARGYTGLTDNKWNNAVDPVSARYLSEYSYDANGNMVGRNGDPAVKRFDQFGMKYDHMSYSYHDDIYGKRLRNRLYNVTDQMPDNIVDEPNDGVEDYLEQLNGPESNVVDINNPAGANNYIYDAMGNLIMDKANGIDGIKWTAMGKVYGVAKSSGATLEMAYDAAGQRRHKYYNDGNGNERRDHYVRDAQGNIMAVYRYTPGQFNSLNIMERPIYGSKRLGVDGYKFQLIGNPPYDPYDDPIGLVNYELTDHLGNVNTVVTDELQVVDVPPLLDPQNDYNQPVIVSAQGYEPFGSLLPGRNYSSDAYRFGFNGMEKDNELSGEDNSYTTEFRQYDPRIARWMSVDPAFNLMPWESPYVAYNNKPIIRSDKQGDCPTCMSAVVGAGLGALMEIVFQVGDHMSQGDDFEMAISKINYADVAKEAAIGGLAGLSGFGAASYVSKATKFLKSPAAQKVLPFIAEMGVDMAVSMAGDMGFDASGLKQTLYEAMGYERLSNKAIGGIAATATKEELVAKYGNSATIGEQVYGSFGDGTGTYFDFVVTDAKTGDILEVVESKANSSQLSTNQKRFYNDGETLTFKGKAAEQLGVAGKKASNSTVTSTVTRRTVNEFTGTAGKAGASSAVKRFFK